VTGVADAALSFLFLAMVPVVVSARLALRASPRTLATLHFLALFGFAVLPAGWLVCAGGGIGALFEGGSLVERACPPRGGFGTLQLGLYVVAGLLLLRVGWHVSRSLVAAARSELGGAALAAAMERPLRSGGSAWVVPSSRLQAYASGIRHPRAVVSSGVLSLLDAEEAAAVLEHEGAHLRLGHTRILAIAAGIASAYAFLAPVRRSFEGLCRELEAAADDEAARAVGAKPLLVALAKVSLAMSTGQARIASFADPEHLRYRIRRLEEGREPKMAACALACGAAAALVGSLSWAACTLLGTHLVWWGLLACFAGFGGLALRAAGVSLMALAKVPGRTRVARAR